MTTESRIEELDSEMEMEGALIEREEAEVSGLTGVFVGGTLVAVSRRIDLTGKAER